MTMNKLTTYTPRYGHDSDGVRPVMIPDDNGQWANRHEAEHLAEQLTEAQRRIVAFAHRDADLRDELEAARRRIAELDELNAIVERLNCSGYEYEGGPVSASNASAVIEIVLQQLQESAESSVLAGNPTAIEHASASLLQLRNLIRQRHAEWSEKTFGNFGPVGPLRHLSQEALEAAAAPDDLSEWADMQFLLWDAQRRAGISDGEIIAAMEEKLNINMARQWEKSRDGEPCRHIERDSNSPEIPDGWVMVPIEPTDEMIIAAMDSDDVTYNDSDDTVFYVQHREIYRAMLAAAPQQDVNNG